MRLGIMCVYIALYSVTLEAQGKVDYSLSEAIEYAMENHNALKADLLSEQDAHYQVKEYTAFGLPQIESGVNYNYFFSVPTTPVEDFISPAIYSVLFAEQVIAPRELGQPDVFDFTFNRKHNLNAFVEMNALLFDGSYIQGLKAAKLFKQMTNKQINVTKKDIKGQVTKAYYSVLVAEKNLEILAFNIQNLEKSLKETQAFYDNGFVEQLDVDRLNLSYETLKTEYEKLEKLILVSKNVLKYQMGYPVLQPINTVDDLEDVLASIVMEDMMLADTFDYSMRPEYEILNMAIDLDKVDLKRINQGKLPRLKAFANFTESIQRDKLLDGSESSPIPSGYVGLGLKLPIWDGNERSAQAQRVKIRMDQNYLKMEEFERGMELQVLNSKISFFNAKKSLVNAQKLMQLNNEIYRKTQIKFKEGVGSSVEVYQAESLLYSAQSQYISALYDLIIAKSDFDIAVGNIK